MKNINLSEIFQFMEVNFSIYLNRACFRNGKLLPKFETVDISR